MIFFDEKTLIFDYDFFVVSFYFGLNFQPSYQGSILFKEVLYFVIDSKNCF